MNTLITFIIFQYNITAMDNIVIETFDIITFGFIMIRSKRYWSICATSIAILEMLINIIYISANSIGYYGVIAGNWAYMSAQIILFYALLATLIYATWSGRRRKRRLAAVERSSPRDAAAA